MLDLDIVRSHFPALSSGYVYMDNAGGSQTLDLVADRIRDYLLTTNVQLGATYEVSRKSGERVADGTAAVKALLNARHDEEVVMGSSTSLNFKILSECLSRGWQPGDEVIVTNADHEANVSPWTALAEKGIVVKTWKLDPQTWRFRTEDLKTLLSPKTKLVAVTHASNLLGGINPIKEIAQLVHANGSLICVDGVAFAPHRAIDVQALDVDFYGFSFYKVYGPHYAVLYGKKHLLETMPGFNLYFINESPYKFQPGNVNFEFAWSMTGLIAYFHQLVEASTGTRPATDREAVTHAYQLIKDHEDHLCSKFLDFLNNKPGVQIIGDKDISLRVPTISFVVEGKTSDQITLACDPQRIGIRYGDFYAKKLIADHGLETKQGVVRVSMVHYNTLDELDRLIAVLDGVL